MKILSSKGFTLIELMLAMVISSVVAMAAYSIFATSNWSADVQGQVSAAQQNARAGMEQLARDIRGAGFGLPEDSATTLKISFTDIPVGMPNPLTAPITITNSSTGPDTITILGIGTDAGKLANGTNCNNLGDTQLCLTSVGIDEFKNKSDGTWIVNRRYISIDGNSFYELADTQASLADNKLTLKTVNSTGPMFLKRKYSTNSRVYIIQAIHYSIGTTGLDNCSTNNPCLTTADYTKIRGSGRQQLAENIEDIQFAYALNGSTTMSTPAATSFASVDISAVRVNVVALTDGKDSKAQSAFGRPAVEDHAAGAGDGRRRRVLSSVVKIRNPLYAL